MRLYELTDELTAIEAELMDNGGELTPELEQRLTDATQDAQGALGWLYRWRVNLLADIDACKDEIQRLQYVKRTNENTLRVADDYVKRLLGALGKDKVATPSGWIRVSQSPPSVRINCLLQDLPDEFTWWTEPELHADKKAMIDHWKATGEVPDGVELVQGTHVRHQKARKDAA